MQRRCDHVDHRVNVRPRRRVAHDARLNDPVQGVRVWIIVRVLERAVEHGERKAAALLGRRGGLERRVQVRHCVQRASERPDIDALVERRVRLDVKELRRAIRHARVLRRLVLCGERVAPAVDRHARLDRAAKVHQDARDAVVGDHDIAV